MALRLTPSDRIVTYRGGTASAEGDRLLAVAQGEIANASARARGELRNEVAKLAVAGAAQLLKREVDAQAHARLLEELSARIAAG